MEWILLKYATIANILRRNGFDAKPPIKKPFLTQEHRRKRVQFAIDNYYRDWTKVIFSDESIIVIDGRTNKKIWVSKEEDRIIKIFKNGFKRNIYACISIRGLEGIIIYNENTDSIKYVTMIDDIITKFPKDAIYQQDNAPYHVSAFTMAVFKEKGINLLPNCPPNSPDLNPIEHFNNCIKQNIDVTKIVTEDNIEEIIIEAIKKISFTSIFNMISNMHNRMEMLIDNDGDSLPF